jgi:hypothetical protein
MRIVRKGDRWTLSRYSARRLELDVAHRYTDGILACLATGTEEKTKTHMRLNITSPNSFFPTGRIAIPL